MLRFSVRWDIQLLCYLFIYWDFIYGEFIYDTLGCVIVLQKDEADIDIKNS